MEQQESCRPVPAPRRLYPELRKSEYENVTVDLINKNLNINSENIHIITNCNEKLPNNKLFLGEESNAANKSILTETNDLYGPDANENVPEYASVTPMPRPRKPLNSDCTDDADNVYENALYENGTTSKPQNTGAISKDNTGTKVLRKAPELPPKTYLSVERQRQRDRSLRHSISSEVSTTSSAAGGANLTDNLFANTTARKSASNVTLNSSMSDSTEGSEGAKFKSPSPGDILKSLGATSKLLTESIGERVALKAKGARHMLDKNLKSSSEMLSNIGTETTNRLKNVSKRFGNNFTMSKADKEKPKESGAIQYSGDRPQTLPPNDRVFNAISFSSPLNAKTPAVDDLSLNDADCSYEVPRSNKVVNPPSYEDALNCPSGKAFTRNVPTSKSLMVPREMAMEAASVALSKQQRNTSLQKLADEKSEDSSSSANRDSRHFPMPDYPPPVLKQEASVYGKLNPVQAPARQKRRRNYEEIQLRRTENSSSPVSGSSLRPNVDSAELHQLNLAAAQAEREESMILRQQLIAAEELTPKPERSNSWEFVNDSRDDSDASSPEPVYANQEATYGRVFELASGNNDILPPQSTLVSICEETTDELTRGAVGGCALSPLPLDILKEFDPMETRKPSTICRSDKSNQLLLLEHLLEEDTYGAAEGGESKSDDDISMCTSEEDNLNSSLDVRLPEQKQKTVLTVQLSKDPTPSRPLQIVHQNATLLSDSMENMLDDKEQRLKPYLSRVDEKPSSPQNIDLSRPTQNRTQWYDRNSVGQGRSNPFNKLNIADDESPPSYSEAIGADEKHTPAPNGQISRAKRLIGSMKIRVDALKRKSSFKAAQKASEVRVTLPMVPKPSLSPLLVRYEGPLIRFPSGVVEDILKEMQNRRAILRDRQFQTFLDQEMKIPKETIPLEFITTVQFVSDNRVTDNSTHFYRFEITTSVPKNGSSSSSSNVQAMSNPNMVMTSGGSGNCKHQRVTHLYGVGKESERGIWMQKILESLTNVLPPKYICHYHRAGWCYLKNSITSEWSGTWLVLKKNKRRLVFVSEATGNVEKMDLRKARCIVLKEDDETIRNLHVETGPILMIDCPPYTVYIIMSSPRETKIWRNIIRETAHNNGFSLSDQQLTKFNVPVIVDKCINFVYIHGSMSEGIYRKSGSENSILKLIAAFRADAFNVEITRNEYNEHDVANVLKRFMRDLPERLMGKMSESFICVTEIGKPTDKIQIYKELLSRLTAIERETLKKIVGHLAFISSQKSKNKMSIQNLTMIWGPTLMKTQQNDDPMIYSQKESDVLAELITFHKHLFPLTPDEMKKEQEMLMCLQKYYASAETLTDSVKKSGDLKIWITLNPNPENTTEEKTQKNVTISPTKTVYEICQELAPMMNMSTHQLSLHEVILNGDLERPLHHDTKIFDVILNWSYWPEEDRKHNYLVVKPIDFLREVQRAIKNLATVTPGKELKFVDNRTKSFKTYQCELRDGKIVISKKDKNDKTTIVREIFLQCTTAYLGCEKKRDFPWSWAITFVERTQSQILRSRDAPFIGHVLAGCEWMDRTIWFSSIWYCLYGDSILPPAEIIIK